MRGEVRTTGSPAAAGRGNQSRVVFSKLEKFHRSDAVKLALHNAYFFRGVATPSNLIQQSVL